MPTISFVLVIQAAMLSNILWPACKWSNVPPRAVTGNNVGVGVVVLGVLDRFGTACDEELSLGGSQTTLGPEGIGSLCSVPLTTYTCEHCRTI